MTESELEPSPHSQAISDFLEALVPKLPENISPPEIQKFLQLFLRLHEKVNDPHTREKGGALAKAQLVQKIAEEQIARRDQDERPSPTIELLTAGHPETYNVVVTLGNPSTGPTTILEVHHDTIAADKYDLNFAAETQTLSGRTIQDNTIHLASILSALSEITIPPTGSIMVVLTDHEENGCLGSGAIKEQLAERLNPQYPVALVALESTSEKLAAGHLGKFSSRLEGAPVDDTVAAFQDFYTKLKSVQHTVYDTESSSGLGHTTGLSPYGEINPHGLSSLLDFRTNDVMTASRVEQVWQQTIADQSARPREPLVAEALTALRQGRWHLLVNAEGIGVITDTDVLHPSNFNPEDDQTVLPIIYAITQALSQHGMSDRVNSIAWGETSKANSNPRTGLLRGDFTGLSTDTLITWLDEIDQTAAETAPAPSSLHLNADQTVLKDSVASPIDQVITHIRQGLAEIAEQPTDLTYMKYMTDIAALFNLLKAQGFSDVYGMVYGVGDEANLHQVESLSPQEVIRIFTMMKKLPNLINEALSVIG
jgi:hypothetical protein